MPEQMTKLASVKASEEYEKLRKESKSRGIRKGALIDFATISNFEIDKLLKSGKVLFNDPMTNYVRSVASKVLSNEPGAYEKITIFTVRSANPNAFTTSSGIIFVNLGLIARLNSEEELAFVLCHEYVHFKKSHGLLGFENALKLEKEARKAARSSDYDEDEWIVRDCLFSKEQESEADLKGLEIYLNSPYKNGNPYGALEALKYSNFPIVGTSKYQPTLLETANFKIPTALLQPDSLYEDYPADLGDEDDKRMSHPNLRRRIEKLTETHAFKSSTLLPSKFDEFKKIAEFESTYFLLAFHNYEFAVAQSAYLLTKYPNNPFLKNIHDQAWFTFSIAMNYRTESYYDQRQKDDEISGPFQPAHYLFKKLGKTKADMTLIALRIAWENSQKSVDSVLWKKRLNNLCYSLITDKGVKPTQLDPDTSKVKKKNTFKSEFKNIYEDLSNASSLKKYLRDYFDNENSTISVYSDKNTKYNEKKGYKLGSNTVLVLNPAFYSIDLRDANPEKHNSSEFTSLQLFNELVDNATRLDMEVVNYGNSNFSNSEVEKVEEAFWLKMSLMEKDLYSESKGHYTSMFDNEISTIRKKYKTDYLMTTTAASAVDRRDAYQVFTLWMFSMTIWPLLPVAVYQSFTPERSVIMQFTVYDISGQGEPIEVEYISKGRYNQLIVSNLIYDMLSQLKSK